MRHEHKDRVGRACTILNSGGHYEVCECGATRLVPSDGRPKITGGDDREGWHTCPICTPDFFLTEGPPTDWTKLLSREKKAKIR
jgi:hypothetical protein